MAVYIYQKKDWPRFAWNTGAITQLLGDVRQKQGRLLGQMKALRFPLQQEAVLQTLTLEVIKTSEIEGDLLNYAEVRSSVARRLGMDIAGLQPSDRHVDGVVDMMLDATQRYREPLTQERLWGWQAALFPTGYSGVQKVVTGGWRNNTTPDPMQVVSGPIGQETVHFEAPPSELLPDEMAQFLYWFNQNDSLEGVTKAAIAHFWFVTLHPFDDGNGRVARALADMLLARAEGSAQRYYSMSAQIRKERNSYYRVLEETQKANLDITEWLQWFLQCLSRSLDATGETLVQVLHKARFWDTHKHVAFNSRQQLMLNKLLDGFEGKLTSSKWAAIAKCSSDTAIRDITDLLNRRILIKDIGGGRSTSYLLK